MFSIHSVRSGEAVFVCQSVSFIYQGKEFFMMFGVGDPPNAFGHIGPDRPTKIKLYNSSSATKLIVAHLFKKLLIFYGTKRFFLPCVQDPTYPEASSSSKTKNCWLTKLLKLDIFDNGPRVALSGGPKGMISVPFLPEYGSRIQLPKCCDLIL